jgi:hypothetical protein
MLHVSGGGGSTWTDVAGVLQDGAALAWGQGLFQAGSYYDQPTTSRQIAVARSTNRGSSWATTVLCTQASGYATSLSFRADNPAVGYVSGYYYDTTWNIHGKIYRTTNAGVSWSEIGASTFDAGKIQIFALVSDPANAARLLAGTASGVYLSSNGGTSWTTPVQSFRAMCLVEDPGTSGRFWAGSDDSGIRSTTDGGVTWQLVNSGLGSLNILSLAYDPVSRALYAGTQGGGLFRYDLATAVAEAPGAPVEYALEQNYPNPFNGDSHIGFRIGGFGLARLQVYDLLGRMVATLVNEWKEPGAFTVRFDAAGLSSGTYVYRLSAGGYVQTRRMVVLR